MSSEPEPNAVLPAQLLRHAATHGDDPAFHVFVDHAVTTLSWAELERRSRAYADHYTAAGARRGDIVVICLRHGPSLQPAFLGAMLAGCVPSFVPFPTPKQDPELYWHEHRVLFDRVRPAVVLTYGDNAERLDAVLPGGTTLLLDPRGVVDQPSDPPGQAVVLPEPDDVALLQHSSGTTGLKKGVQLTYRQLDAHARSYAATLGLSSGDRIASWLPLYHDMGLIATLVMPVQVGATVVSLDAFEWAEDPHSLLHVIDEYDCQYAWLPNFALAHLVRTKRGDERYRLGRARTFVMSSEVCRPETFDEFVSVFASHEVRADQLSASYAMAETVFAVSQSAVGERVGRVHLDARGLAAGRAIVTEPGPGALEFIKCGPVLEGLEVRVDPADVADGEGDAIGELQVRGEFVFSGYHGNADATREAFADGWYRTGDLGFLADGQPVVLGRRKDIVIYHGVNYYAGDLEAVAATVPGVRPGRCVALAVPDPATGSERVELVVESDDSNVSPAELESRVKHAIAQRYAIAVALVRIVEPGWLVKTTSGKVSRAENLRKHLTERVATSTPVAEDASTTQSGDLQSTVIATIASTFDVAPDAIDGATVAADVEGWDSLGHTVLMIRLGNAIGVDVPEGVAAEAQTVGELIEMLRAHLGTVGSSLA
jgi:acyl-CoA synthetase (AMP-forming)/AMP-acid ligase II/acyl carrier protein